MNQKRKLLALILLLLVVGGAAASAWLWSGSSSQAATPAEPRGGEASAVFAGGCFWCTESDFDHIPGVVSTTSGYIGGQTANPTYEQVSAGDTGHIEAVRVVYDPARVSYATLAQHFFRTIDPTDDGGSFCDRGYQYRSAIFPASDEERRLATEAKDQAAQALGRPVATLILPNATFYPAEDYHQDYATKNPARYRFYRWKCGREQRLAEVWGKAG
jgi:peptide-methionine (S)-S-oxide reductase